MVLWLFWPNFCSAMVPADQISKRVINTLVTYVAGVALRRGKLNITDMANAALAGGVAIGSTINQASAPAAMLTGCRDRGVR